METTIMNVLDSVKGSADEITHSLREFGRGDMRKGVENIYNIGFTNGYGNGYEAGYCKCCTDNIIKFGIPALVVSCLGFQTIKYIKFKQKISKATDGETE